MGAFHIKLRIGFQVLYLKELCCQLWSRVLPAFLVFLIISFNSPAGAQESQSLGDLARAVRAKQAAEANQDHPQPPQPPIAESALLAWQIGGMPSADMLSEIKSRGIAFDPDDAHLNVLKDAHLAPEVLSALPGSPSHPDSGSSEVPRDLIDAVSAASKKDYPVARRSLEGLVRQDANADLYVALGNLNFLAGDLPSAKASFLRAAQFAPAFAYAHVCLARVYYRLDQSSEMTAEARVALKLQPGNAEARKYLALSAVMGSHESGGSANAPVESAGEDLSDLNAGQNQEAKTLNNEAIQLTARHDYLKAEAAYRRAIELDPGVALFYYNLGNMYWDEWGISGGEKWEPVYRQAKTLAPRNLAIRQNLGYAFCKSGRYAEAVTEFRELLGIDPTWNMARPCLITALDNLGRRKEADEVEKDYERYGGETDSEAPGPHL